MSSLQDTKTLDHSSPNRSKKRRCGVRSAIAALSIAFLAAIVAGICVSVYSGSPRAMPKIQATRASLHIVKQALEAFEVDHDRFPTTEEGLEALVHPPKGADGSRRPYLKKVPVDSWGRSFVYRLPSATGQPFFDLYSDGPDGQDGTPDDITEE